MSSANMPAGPSAQSLVLAKGFFDVFLGVSLMFAPSLVYEGAPFHWLAKTLRINSPLPSGLLPSPHFTFASLILGAAVSAIRAGRSNSSAAHQSVACLNATFAFCLLLGTIFSPHHLGSSFTLFAALQDVVWVTMMVRAGGWTVGEMMGWAGIGDALEETRQRGKVVLGNATENGKEKLVAAKEVGMDQVQAVKGTAERLATEVTQDSKKTV